jgi:predicted negative regulator of RcsB-dependent stress response
MAERSSLVGKEERIIDIERKDGLLEELNLPPKAIKFIRKNSLYLQIGVGCLVLLIFGWTYYDIYTQGREKQAASALSLAVGEADGGARLELLTGVAADFPGTYAALWSQIEQAHIALQDGKFDDALALYGGVLTDLAGDSPLHPLLSYNIGLAYENGGKHDLALTYYEKLAGYPGFAVKGLMAQGRIHVLRGEEAEALRVYRAAATNAGVTDQDKSLLTEKINALQASSPAGKES